MEHTATNRIIPTTTNKQSPILKQEKQARANLSRPKKINRKWDGSSAENDEDSSLLNFGNDNIETGRNIRHPLSSSLYNTGETVPELIPIRRNTNSGTLSSILEKINELSGISKTLTAENLTSPLSELKESLMRKNVAEIVASKICESVEIKLVGKQISTFSTFGILVSYLFRVFKSSNQGSHLFNYTTNSYTFR